MEHTVYYIIDRSMKNNAKLLKTVKKTRNLAVMTFGLCLLTLYGLGSLGAEVEKLKSKGETEM